MSCGEVIPDVAAADFGVTVGAGVDVALRTGVGLGLDALYSLGLKELNDAGNKTRFLAIQAGVVFVID